MRQALLTERRSIAPDIKQGLYPFKNIKLSRADVEWLLATHEHGRGRSFGKKSKTNLNTSVGQDLICAEEIEKLMLAHAAIMNAACVPMPDPMLGERVCAFVILRSGMTVTLEELTGFLLAKGIAKFKLPERLEVVDDFPLSKFGKVAKNVLTQQVTEKLTKAQI